MSRECAEYIINFNKLKQEVQVRQIIGKFLANIGHGVCMMFGTKRTKERLRKIERLEKDHKEASDRISMLLGEMERKTILLNGILDGIPDWAWHKDVDGRYVNANSKIREELFCGLPLNHIIGHTDVEIATKLKAMYGEEKHTFGQLCANSDAIVLETNKSQKFYESGLVKGIMVRVIVYKSTLYDSSGNLLGTVGTGRNVSEDYMYLEDISNLTTDVSTSNLLHIYMDKYKFDDNKQRQ